jgi:hypothetical protein
MPNIHFMITSLPPTRGCEEPLKLGNNVEVTVVGGMEMVVVDMRVEVVVTKIGAAQHLVQILAT